MRPRVRRAAALEDRLLSGSRAGCPLPGAHGGADPGASRDDSGNRRFRRGRRLVRARLLQPPPPLPPHITPPSSSEEMAGKISDHSPGTESDQRATTQVSRTYTA